MSWDLWKRTKACLGSATGFAVLRTAIDVVAASADALAWEAVANGIGPNVSWPIYLARMAATGAAGAFANASTAFVANMIAIKLFVAENLSMREIASATVKENFVKRGVQSFVDGLLWKPLVDGGNWAAQQATGDPSVSNGWAIAASTTSVFVGTGFSTLVTNRVMGLQDSAVSSAAAAAGFNVDNFTTWFSVSDMVDASGAVSCTAVGRLAGEVATLGITAIARGCRKSDEMIPLFDVRNSAVESNEDKRRCCTKFFSTVVVDRMGETKAFMVSLTAREQGSTTAFAVQLASPAGDSAGETYVKLDAQPATALGK